MAYGKKGSRKQPGLKLKSDMKMEGASRKSFKGKAGKKLHHKEEPKK